jgi:hypothetical protein
MHVDCHVLPVKYECAWTSWTHNIKNIETCQIVSGCPQEHGLEEFGLNATNPNNPQESRCYSLWKAEKLVPKCP